MTRRSLVRFAFDVLERRNMLSTISWADHGDALTDDSGWEPGGYGEALPGRNDHLPDERPQAAGPAGGDPDLRITNLRLVDAENRPIAALTIGQKIFIRAEWIASGLSAADRYSVRYWVDGVSLDSGRIVGQPGDNVPHHWWRGGWYASPGIHEVRVQIDGQHEVSEDNESNNVLTFTFTAIPPTDLPEKFVLPIAGIQGPVWTIQNYVDIYPRAGFADYRGGGVSYDEHDAIDFSLSNFAAMDAGVPVYAVAAGTVIDVHDGEFDRHGQWASPSPPSNRLTILHGNGWETTYLHLRQGSITVSVGDRVTAGTQIGLVGSSGRSSGAHLHFRVQHYGSDIETLYAPDQYWKVPPTYTYDMSPHLMDFGITNQDPTYARIMERPSQIEHFSGAGGQYVVGWGIYSSLNVGDTIDVRFVRPSGQVYSTAPRTIADDYPWSWWYFSVPLPEIADVGQWNVEWWIDGQLLQRTPFRVGGMGSPEAELFVGETYILDGRTTAIDFGQATPIDPVHLRRFELHNVGERALTIDDIVLPDGFILTSPPLAALAPGRSTTFELQLTTEFDGLREGWVRILTNDKDESSYDFKVRGHAIRPKISGDVNGDMLVNAADINALYDQVRSEQYVSTSDLNRDQQVDHNDVNQLVIHVLDSMFGDANLDGMFDSSDLILIFEQGQYEDSLFLNSNWISGDWNGDQDFDSSDLIFALQRGVYTTNSDD